MHVRPVAKTLLLGLGVALKKQRKYAEALETFTQAILGPRGDAWLPLHAAECCLRLGRYDQALALLHQTLDWLPGGRDAERIFGRVKMLFAVIEEKSANADAA